MTSDIVRCTVWDVAELRTAKVTVLLEPAVLARLDAWRAERRWSRSTAIAALIEDGLSREQDDSKELQ